MPDQKRNEPASPQSQPVKSLSELTFNFIADCAQLTSTLGVFTSSAAAIAIQAILVRLGGMP
jgi:hypothetical protein